MNYRGDMRTLIGNAFVTITILNSNTYAGRKRYNCSVVCHYGEDENGVLHEKDCIPIKGVRVHYTKGYPEQIKLFVEKKLQQIAVHSDVEVIVRCQNEYLTLLELRRFRDELALPNTRLVV